ncbi:hypothetical protein EDD86DRAFT_141014, partial [Gorgonomyces haynaldii]
MNATQASNVIKSIWRQYKTKKDLSLVNKTIERLHERQRTLEQEQKQVGLVHASRLDEFYFVQRLQAVLRIQRWWRRLKSQHRHFEIESVPERITKRDYSTVGQQILQFRSQEKVDPQILNQKLKNYYERKLNSRTSIDASGLEQQLKRTLDLLEQFGKPDQKLTFLTAPKLSDHVQMLQWAGLDWWEREETEQWFNEVLEIYMCPFGTH